MSGGFSLSEVAGRCKHVTAENCDRLESHIRELKQREQQMLPIEADEKRKLGEHIQLLERQLSSHRLGVETGGSKLLDLDFLKVLRQPERLVLPKIDIPCFLPQYAVFTPDSPVCQFSIRVTAPNGHLDDREVDTDGVAVSPLQLWSGMPECNRRSEVEHRRREGFSRETLTKIGDGSIKPLLQAVVSADLLPDYYGVVNSLILSTTFGPHLLPNEARKRIADWQSAEACERVFLITEAETWSLASGYRPEDELPVVSVNQRNAVQRGNELKPRDVLIVGKAKGNTFWHLGLYQSSVLL